METIRIFLNYSVMAMAHWDRMQQPIKVWFTMAFQMSAESMAQKRWARFLYEKLKN